MTTLGFKSRAPPGQGHERMGREIKFGVKAAPQVKLSFPPGRPPTLDPAPPAPAPAKPQGNRSFWSGQVWSHLTNMFNAPPTVNWVNPQLVRECHPAPPLAHYTPHTHHQYMPPPALTHGGGLWHPAPPGNQQQMMMMMEPIQMVVQGRDGGGGYLSAKMGMNGYYPSAKMGTDHVYPNAKTGTSNSFPGAKLGTNGYYPCGIYPNAKTDTNGVYPGTKMGTNGYYPRTEMEAECVYPSAEMDTNGYVLVAKPVPESFPATTTTTTTTSSKPLNPYAREWVPPGYYVTTTATPVVLKAPHHHSHHQESTPIIPYSPQDFQNDPIEDALSADAFVNTKALDTLNVTQVDPTSATSHRESPGQSTESKGPIGCQEEGEESPILGPEVPKIAEEGKREGESASPQSTASPDCIKIVKPDVAKSSPTSNTSSQGPEEVGVCFVAQGSPNCIKIAKSDLDKSSSSSNTSSQSPERVPVCVRLPSERTQTTKGVPGDAKQGYDSATRSHITKRVPDSANEVLVTATSSQSSGKVPCSATRNQRVLDSEKKASSSASGSPSATVSYARVVERATPSPPPPQSTEDEKYKGVEQPIPKIFQRDRTPPREVPAPVVGTCRMPELFRRPTKDQRTRSRRFLKELKERSGVENGGDGVDWCSSSFSSSSSSSSSPSSVSSSSSSSFCDLPQVSSSSQPLPPSSSSSSSSSFPCSSPVPISPLHPPRPPRSTPPMTPTSPGRERSESESSAVSLDIDFTDDVDCAFVAPVSAVPSASAKKPINRFLACILGSGESDSEEEEEEEEEEDDWDEICVMDSAGVSANGVPDLDDSWETFGLEMIVLQCRKDPAKEECQGEPSLGVPESECQSAKTDDETESSNLAEINARWEREVSEGVPVKSATRVRFGGTTVHPMVVWSHAYRKARSGPWEQQARDRARFRQRIGTVEMELAPILEASHRTAVYERLFGTTNTSTDS